MARDLGVTWSHPIRPSLGRRSRGPLSGTLAGGTRSGGSDGSGPPDHSSRTLDRPAGRRRPTAPAQKPSANLASSLISSGVHGGENVIVGLDLLDALEL